MVKHKLKLISISKHTRDNVDLDRSFRDCSSQHPNPICPFRQCVTQFILRESIWILANLLMPIFARLDFPQTSISVFIGEVTALAKK